MCNSNDCKAYGEYVEWLDSHEFKSDLNIIGKLESVAHHNGTKVHQMLEHKQCHQFVDHKTHYNQRWREKK